MIAGIGVDAVDIGRMRRALERSPRLATRLFTDQERAVAGRRASRAASLAARFAAKEACRKALGGPVRWRDVEVVSSDDGVPTLHVRGRDDLRFHVSLTHTADLAVAMVVAERPA